MRRLEAVLQLKNLKIQKDSKSIKEYITFVFQYKDT